MLLRELFLNEAESTLIAVGDSHARAIGNRSGWDNRARDGARISRIRSQLQNIPRGSTVALSAGHNDAVAGTDPDTIANGVAALIRTIERSGATAVYFLFPEGTDNNNQENVSRARAAVRSRIRNLVDLESLGTLGRDGIHMNLSAYGRAAEQAQDRETSSSSTVDPDSADSDSTAAGVGSVGADGMPDEYNIDDTMTSTSGWAAELFGRANALANKPQPDPDSGTGGGAGGTAAGPGGAPDPVTGASGGSVGGSGVDASSDLITMLKGFEGYGEKVNPSQGNRSNVRPYWDVRQWSIGYGSYAGSRNRSQRPNIEWTPAEAEQQLLSQLRPYRNNVETINRRGGYRWGAAQLDALTSFAYNIGSINQLTANATRSNREIADKMLEYSRADGQRLSGLVNRRRIERQKFLSGMSRTQLDYRPGSGTGTGGGTATT